MARLKLKLSTGVEVEKPVVTCFNVEGNTYLILDAENIGSMGLPIILVCKVDNGTVKKIVDSAEWQKAKDYLKGIIAGNSMDYVQVAPELAADEVYYTQLTLPVASFDVIKNSYKVADTAVEEPIVPVVDPISVIEPAIPEISPVNPIPTAPVIEVTTPEITAEQPVINEPAVPVIPEVPTVESATASGIGEVNINDINLEESKEAFMKACENMFDALVAKLQAELNSKK